MLRFTGNRIQGQVRGKAVFVQTLTPTFASGGAHGVYQLLPPGSDPVFGDYVMALRVAAGPGAVNEGPWGTMPGSASFPKMRMPPSAASFPKMRMQPNAASFPKMRQPPGGASFPKMRMPAGGTAAGDMDELIVLATRAMPGRNCLVVVSGFADLLEALGAEGGVQLTIS